jgi:hypothetical protein
VNMSVSEHYKHFAHVLSNGPATPLLDMLAMVHDLSGGKADPAKTKHYWDQWQHLKQAFKDNHPMVKLAAALVPSDPVPVVQDENQPVGHVTAVADYGHDKTLLKGRSSSFLVVDDPMPAPSMAGLDGLLPMTEVVMLPPGKPRSNSDPSSN